MASGLPVVLPNSGGVTMYACPNNAYCAAPNAAAFAAQVELAFSPEGCRTDRIEAAMKTARDHSWDHAARHFLDIYQAVHAQVHGAKATHPPPIFVSTREYSR
jgi:glycosyltransferase involved in cell wall biosynthesis